MRLGFSREKKIFFYIKFFDNLFIQHFYKVTYKKKYLDIIFIVYVIFS